MACSGRICGATHRLRSGLARSSALPRVDSAACRARSLFRRRPDDAQAGRAAAGYQRLQVRMVEGHQCHRVAHHHRKALMGKKFEASSPNGRFVDGAAAIDGQVLHRIEVVGKNLFYFFGSDATSPIVLHFHFGMSGAFKTWDLQKGKEPTPTTRLRLENREENILAHLSAMTVQHGELALYEEKYKSLGPDPLREDADKERFWAKVNSTKKPIGLLLMDQSCIAGVGNIYRAEILFQANLHPEQPANTVSRDKFEEVWRWCVLDLQRGFKTGSILTVEPADAKALGPPWTRRSSVRSWDMASRTVYACETCQRLPDKSLLTDARSKALAAASPTKVFKSHCAPEGPETLSVDKQTVAELRAQLAEAGLETVGRKAELVSRLKRWAASSVKGVKHSTTSAGPQVTTASPTAVDGKQAGVPSIRAQYSMKEVLQKATVAELKEILKAVGLTTQGKKADLISRLEDHYTDSKGVKEEKALIETKAEAVETGTGHIGPVASAQEAALEKARAGENRAVEHVALFDEKTTDFKKAEKTSRSRAKRAAPRLSEAFPQRKSRPRRSDQAK